MNLSDSVVYMDFMNLSDSVDDFDFMNLSDSVVYMILFFFIIWTVRQSFVVHVIWFLYLIRLISEHTIFAYLIEQKRP